MPLVFVHGVTTRSGPDYDKEVLIRNAFFRRFALTALAPESADVEIFNTYWGDAGANFLWNHASLPKEAGLETFGPADETAALILNAFFGNQPPEGNRMLLQVARHSLDDVVDLLGLVASFLSEDGANEAEGLAKLASATKRYIQENPAPLWLERVQSDQDFLDHLIYHVNQWVQSKYQQTIENRFWDLLRYGRIELVHRLTAMSQQVERLLSFFSRVTLHQRIALFLGDVFVYLRQGTTPAQSSDIISKVLVDLDKASEWQQKSKQDKKLVIVTHSMGGNIMYDILTSHRPDLHVDAFVTVGSQVALFEELKLFEVSSRSIPSPEKPRESKPANVDHWLNVFDRNDFLGFATEGVFTDTKDFAFTTHGTLLTAHSKYFTLSSFHKRLEERLREIGV